MRFLRFNTATRVTVGPFLDKSDGITPKTSLTVTSEKLTFVVDESNVPTLILDTAPTASGGSNDMVHITGDDAGLYDLELAAADTNHLGRAILSLNDVATHCPVFHEYMIIPQKVYDSLFLGTDNLEVDSIQVGGTTQTARDIGASVLLSSGTGTGQLDFTSGVVKSNQTQILGTAVSTPTVAGVPNVNVKTWNDLTTVALPLVPTTAGRTLDVSAGGEAGVDWANVGSPTTAVNLSGTNIKTDQVVASVTGAVGSVTGNVGGNVVGSIGSFSPTRSGTAQTNTDVTKIKLDSGASATDNDPAYVSNRVRITGGTGSGQSAIIQSYVGSTKVATVIPSWLTAPTNDSTFVIESATVFMATSGVNSINSSTISSTAIQGLATGIWQDSTSGDFTVAGSIGKSLYTGNVAPGGSGGLLISGTNSGTLTLGALTVTGAMTLSDGLIVSAPSTTNRAGISVTGNGTGAGISIAAGATGKGVAITTAAGDGLSILATGGHGMIASATGSGKNGIYAVSGSADGLLAYGVNGIHGQGDGNGFGLYAEASGSGDGHGVRFKGVGNGHGLSLLRGATGGGDDLKLENSDAPTVAAVVWDEVITTGHAVSNSAAVKLVAAGSAGDPWSTALPGSYGSGTAGKIIGDNINATISSRAAATSINAVTGTSTSSGSTTTLVDTARTEADTDYWKGMILAITSGACVGQARRISGFNAATDTITVSRAFTQTIASGVTYAIRCESNDVDVDSIGADLTAGSNLSLMTKTGGAGAKLNLTQLNVIATAEANGAVQISNTNGPGIKTSGASTGGNNGHGIYAIGSGTNGNGIYAVSGSADGLLAYGVNGIHGLGDGNGFGLYGEASGSGNGSGARFKGVGTGHGLSLLRGSSGTDDLKFENDVPQLAQGAPAAAPTFTKLLGLLNMMLRNKQTESASQFKLFADDESTVVLKQDVTDSSGTLTRGEMVTGP